MASFFSTGIINPPKTLYDVIDRAKELKNTVVCLNYVSNSLRKDIEDKFSVIAPLTTDEWRELVERKKFFLVIYDVATSRNCPLWAKNRCIHIPCKGINNLGDEYGH